MSKPPQEKINWLKRLKMDMEDDDSSDATPQPTTSDAKPAAAKTKEKEPPPDESKAVTAQNSTEKQLPRPSAGRPKQRKRGERRLHKLDRKKRVKVAKVEDGGRRTAPTQQEGTVRKRPHAAMAAKAESGGDGGRRPTLKELEAKMAQRKRARAEMAATDQAEPSVHLVSKVPVDPAKAKAAAFRQRRMRKLKARRKATGEDNRRTAVKQKRLEAAEASRLKRNQRDQLRKTGAIGALATKNGDAKETEPRPPPVSGEEAKERRNLRERQRRASLKAKTEVAAKGKALVLSKHSLSAELERQKRQEELRQMLGAEPRVPSVKPVEPRQKRRKVQLERKETGTRTLEEQANKVASKISPVKTLSRNTSEIRATGTSKAEEITDAEAQQNITQNGESKKSDPQQSLSPNSVTNEGVKLEQAGVGQIKTEQADFVQTKVGSICGGEGQPKRKRDLSGDQDLEPELEEEGEINSPALVSGASDKVTELPSGKPIDEKNDMLLDMMPIPRKSFKREPVDENAASFVIPKRSAFGQVGDNPASRASDSSEAPSAVVKKPLPSPKSSPQLSRREPIPAQRKRKKNPVPVKTPKISTEDQVLMRLGRKRNSIFMAAGELASQPSASAALTKMSTIPMMGYEVLDIDGKVLPDSIPRLSCATKREMSSAKGSFPASFFGVSLSAPKATESNCLAVDQCTGEEEGEVREMSCYEELQFERPEDRDFYQRRMYGTTFAPLQLRGRTTVTVKNVRFERKSTGIRFNQDRDREEFAAALSKRYTFNKSVPRCNIPRENWQKLSRNQSAMVYLYYYNREDAERASHAFHDDLGNPLELKREYKAGVSRGSSPAAEGRSNRAPQRSCSSERSGPEPSPLSSHGGSTRSTHQRREYQRAANGDYRDTRYEDPPPAQTLLQSESAIKNDSTRRHEIGSGEEEEEGEIESSAVGVPNPAIQGDEREVQRRSPRCRQQPHEMQSRQRQEDFRGDSRNHMREPVEDYRRYEDRNRGPNRRRSRSRSRPRPAAPAFRNGSGRDGSWDPYPKERCRSREFGPTDHYDGNNREWRMNSDNMDHNGGRGYRDYNGHRGDAYSRQY